MQPHKVGPEWPILFHKTSCSERFITVWQPGIQTPGLDCGRCSTYKSQYHGKVGLLGLLVSKVWTLLYVIVTLQLLWWNIHDRGNFREKGSVLAHSWRVQSSQWQGFEGDRHNTSTFNDWKNTSACSAYFLYFHSDRMFRYPSPWSSSHLYPPQCIVTPKIYFNLQWLNLAYSS